MNGADADVVVVGSGPAGVSAAWPLVEAGFFVVMVDAAAFHLPTAPQQDVASFRRSGEGWRHAFGDDLAGLALDGDQSPKFATRIGLAVLANDLSPPPIHATNFVAVRSIGQGGLSAIWGAFASTFDDCDLRDFPLSASDLAASYERVAGRLGLSGADDDLGSFHGGGLPLQRATWISPIARRLLDRYRELPSSDSFRLGIARNAVATEAMPGREACNRCGLCLYGCARGAIYNAAGDLDRLRNRPNFKYLDHSHVMRLLKTAKAGAAVEIGIGAHRTVMRGRALVLGAGTLNSTSLILGLYSAFGRPVRLLTNPVAASAFLMPSELGRPLPDGGFSLGQLSYRLPLNVAEGYATGVIYTADTLPFSSLAQKIPLSRPAALRVARAMAPAVLLATLYLPGRFSRNQLTLDRDSSGQPQTLIEGQTTDEAHRLLRGGMRQLARSMRKLGALALPGSFSTTRPGTDAHLAGTLPMAESGGPLTCTPNCEVRPWQDIFVVDGSCLPALPAKHPTFTIMANADRVARTVATRLAHPTEPANWSGSFAGQS